MWFTVPPVSASPSYLRPVPDAPASPVRRPPVGTSGARVRSERRCARPGCRELPSATLRFAYDRREAWLEGLVVRTEPGSYDLCGPHADRTRPPHGWALTDRRPRDPQPAAGTPSIDPGSDVAPAETGPTPTGPEAVSEDRPAPAAAPGVDRGDTYGRAGPLVMRATRSSSVPVPRALIPRPETPAHEAARPPVWDRGRGLPEVVAGGVVAATDATAGHGGPREAGTVLDAANGTAHPLPLGGITW